MKIRMKKVLCVLAALVLVSGLVLLSGCEGKDDPQAKYYGKWKIQSATMSGVKLDAKQLKKYNGGKDDGDSTLEGKVNDDDVMELTAKKQGLTLELKK